MESGTNTTFLSLSVALNAVLRGLFVGGGARKQGQAARMVRSLAALYPGRKWVVPQLCPEEYGGFFEQMGLQRAPLHQVQMLCELQGISGA